jgi:hypothetical protein
VAPSLSYADFPEDAIITCIKCGAKNFRTDNLCRGCEENLESSKAAYLRSMGSTLGSERGTMVKEVIMKYPMLREKILKRIGATEMPGDDFYIEAAAIEDVGQWSKKVSWASDLEQAGRLDEAAHMYEDLGMWSEAGKIRAGRTTIVREVVLIRCSYCGSLSPQGTLKCSSCGGRL